MKEMKDQHGLHATDRQYDECAHIDNETGNVIQYCETDACLARMYSPINALNNVTH